MQWVLFYFFLHHQNDFSFSHTIIDVIILIMSFLTLTYYAVGAFLFFFTPSNDFFIFLDHNCSDNNNNVIFSPYLLCSGCFYTRPSKKIRTDTFFWFFPVFFDFFLMVSIPFLLFRAYWLSCKTCKKCLQKKM